MKSLSFNSKIGHTIIFTFIISCFLGCSGNQDHHQKEESKLQLVDNHKTGIADLFLNYIDSLVKLPLAQFNEPHIQALNKKFSGKLKLEIYHDEKHDSEKSIVVQYYKNGEKRNMIKAGVICLIPKPISDSLRIADFASYFGSIKEEKPEIGITAQPLPVKIKVSDSTTIKLTFNNHEKLDQAHVIMVEILKYN
ncbi:hypothetical protein [Pedobacter sp. GR22-10]|uniref:hypothetical protein n=1 Tax=Pedobacter sp. GR22-10 TaxID=2994472 RepID=UPI002246C7CD|nr:hypothetical protein [Pedobacter sp. GR22-10]MCX2432412.1 hypothetical protein [Pedobacter sp. GR22-10]